MTKKIEIEPSLIADGKRLYETTDTATRVIAVMLGISRGCLNDRIAEWGWQRRRLTKALPAPAAGEGAVAQQPAAAVPEFEPPLPYAERLRRVIDAQLQVAERTLKVLGPASSAEAERTGRILALVSRTVQDITATAQGRLPADEANNDTVPRDMDVFRETLALRIRSFIDEDERGAGADNGEAPESADGSGP